MNKDRKEYFKKWREEHKEHIAQYKKEYVKNNGCSYKRLQMKYKDLETKLKEKDKIINKIEKRCNQEINAATIQYERHQRSDIWQYIIAHKRILEILERDKNDN